MDKIEFIEYIKHNKQLNELINKYNPYIVVLCGSRAIDTNVDTSDWDLAMYCPEKSLSFMKNIRIENDKNLSVHIMMTSVENIIRILLESVDGVNHFYTLTALSQGTLSSDRYYIIYKRANHPLFDILTEYKRWICELGIYRLLVSIQYELKEIYTNKNLLLSYKIYTYFLMAYDIITNSDSTKLIKKFKSGKNKTEEELQEFYKKIDHIHNFYNNFDESKYEILKVKLEVLLNGYNN